MSLLCTTLDRPNKVHTHPAPTADCNTPNNGGCGSNGNCTVGYLCNAGTGYDGPTGLGTPKGSLSPF